jgi:RHS repeat-associated protein
MGVPASALTRKFTGKERDAESGLDNFGARYNASSLGRFTTPDPLYIEARRLADPQRLNLYAYARNNPVTITDPTGLDVALNCDTKQNCRKAVDSLKQPKGCSVQSRTRQGWQTPRCKGERGEELEQGGECVDGRHQ